VRGKIYPRRQQTENLGIKPMLLAPDEKFKIVNDDCIRQMRSQMDESSIDCMITSVPFPSTYSYTNLDNDLGNSETYGEMKIHFSYWFRALYRVMKPGRIACVHCMQLPPFGRRKDMFDFRGLLIRLGQRSGFLYDNDWLIWRNPQSEAIRTHAHGLLFVTLERDRVKTRPAMAEYIIKFIKPGENAVPINSPGITRDDWIKWADSCWHGIRSGNTLNTKEAKGDDDSRHICPLQLDTIDRLIRLYSNPGEIVLDPFSGIGSTGYECMKLERRYFGIELKKEYYEVSLRNMQRSIERVASSSASLFDNLVDPSDDPPDRPSDDLEHEPESDLDFGPEIEETGAVAEESSEYSLIETD
jgi:DNA modification methylase